VTTGVGAQGLPGLGDACDALDAPAAIADAICHLLADDTHWLERAGVGHAYALAHFSTDAMRAELARALELS
jgi:hypothetical protein